MIYVNPQVFKDYQKLMMELEIEEKNKIDPNDLLKLICDPDFVSSKSLTKKRKYNTHKK